MNAPAPSLLEAARAVAPVLAAEAADNERAGRLSERTLAALRDAGFFHMWLPKEFGGREAWPLESLEAIEALAYGDPSAAWVTMAAGVAMGSAAAYLAPAAARAIFGDGTAPVIAGQGGAIGRAQVAPGGYRLGGKWRYGSGILHAAWSHTGAIVFDGAAPRRLANGLPEPRIFIVPVAEAKLLGNWDVMGLKATGSIDYTMDDVFVADDYTHHQGANEPNHGGDVYRLGIIGFSAIGHSGFALGLARRVLDEIREIAVAEPSRSSLIPERGGGESFREDYGNAEAKLLAARAFVVQVQTDIEATVRRADLPATRQLTLARLALNHVTQVAHDVCTFAYKYAGGAALRDGLLQRCFRDMHGGTQHASTTPAMLRLCATELLGLAPGKVWTLRSLADPE